MRVSSRETRQVALSGDRGGPWCELRRAWTRCTLVSPLASKATTAISEKRSQRSCARETPPLARDARSVTPPSLNGLAPPESMMHVY